MVTPTFRYLNITWALHYLLSVALSHSSRRHPSATQGHLHSDDYTKYRSALHRPATWLLHHYPSSQPILIYSPNVSKPSRYSLIHSTRQLSLQSRSSMHLFIPKSQFRSLSPNFSNTFIYSALLIPQVSDPYNNAGKITPSYRQFFAFRPNPLLLGSRTLYHIHFISSILCLLQPQVLTTIHFP